MNDHEQLVEFINNDLEILIPVNTTLEDCITRLSEIIEKLILNDFQKLVHILYRVDVDELKLKKMLKESEGTNTALLISRLVLDRELQKMIARKKYKNKPGASSEDHW